jgi:hypothetical protein
MKKVGLNYKKTGELESVEMFPPNDHCGWYGLVVKPKWMPSWLAWMVRNRLPIYLGWLNMPSPKKPYNDPARERWWFIYPTGTNAYDAKSIRVKPFLWCDIEWIGPVKNIKGELIEWKERGIYRDELVN